MGTRARIGIEQSNGKVLSVYLHNGDNVGGVLTKHVTTAAKALQLVRGGDMSRITERGPTYYPDAPPLESKGRIAFEGFLSDETGYERLYLFTAGRWWEMSPDPEWRLLGKGAPRQPPVGRRGN